MGPPTHFIDPTANAHTIQGYDAIIGDRLIEADIEFNSNYSYIISGSAGDHICNLQAVATHEMGHWFGLGDLYGDLNGFPQDTGKVMCGIYGNRTTLSQDDIDGVNWIYNHPAPNISHVIPAFGDNAYPIQVNITGRNFRESYATKMNAILSKGNQTPITATDVKLISSSDISCLINITGAESGSWNVTVQNFDNTTETLLNGFIIFPYNCSVATAYGKNGVMNTYIACPPFVTTITPATGVNTGSVSIINLSGETFNTSATVNLTRTGQPNITATNVQVVSSSQITCTLPLTGKAAGQWNIVVTNPDGQSGILANGFTVTAANPGNTPFVIDPSAMNTFDGQYLKSRGFGWCDFGGVNNSYYKITLAGTTQYPTEFHLKKSFTTKAQFGILVQASNVRISGVDLSTAPNADQRPVNSITNTYAPLTLAETGAAGIKVSSGYTGVKLVDVNVVGQNVPAVHVDGSNLDIIGTNNPDPYLTTYSGSGINDNWGTTLTGKLNSGYGLGLLQQTSSQQ